MTLRFPIWLAYKETENGWVVNLFDTKEGAATFLNLGGKGAHKTSVESHRLLLNLLQTFENNGVKEVELVGDNHAWTTMTIQQVRELPFVNPSPP